MNFDQFIDLIRHMTSNGIKWTSDNGYIRSPQRHSIWNSCPVVSAYEYIALDKIRGLRPDRVKDRPCGNCNLYWAGSRIGMTYGLSLMVAQVADDNSGIYSGIVSENRKILLKACDLQEVQHED